MAASLKISELNALTAMADDDLFLVTDTSATTSKKVSFSTLKSNIAAAATNLVGVSAGVAHLGTFSGTTIADSQTVKQALQSLETRLEAVDIDTDDMATLVGLAENVQNLGTFSGSLIADNDSIKDALQTLETATELRATAASPTLTGTISLAGEGTFKGLDDNLELDPSGTTGILKIGTKLLSSHQMEIGTVGFQTMLKGVVAINHANSELKIQNSNRIYVENTPVVLDGGGVVTIADNNAAALDIKEGSNSLLKIITTNGSESTELGTALTISGLTTLAGGGTLGVDGSDAANFELNKAGTAGLIKLGTRMVSSQKQVIGTPSFDTTLKGTIAMSGTTSEYKIQTANRVYIENTPIVLDNGGVVTISDNNAAALDIKEGSNSLLKIVTTNGSEAVAVGTNLTVAGALVLDSAVLGTVQTSGESFADNDTSLMTSKAIDDRIAVTAAAGVTQASLHIDDIHSALGIASEAVNFGTFTGSTIGDNLTLKAAVQALETATELRATLASPTFTGTSTFAGGGELEASGSDFAINKSGSSGLIKIGTGMTGSQKQEIGTVNIDTTLKGVIAMSGSTSEYKIQSANRVYLEATPIVFDNGGTVTVSDNQAAALDIKEGSNSLLKIVTTNGSEAVAVGTNLTVAGNLSVTGTTTTVDTVTMTATNAITFEGATANDHESTLTIVDPTADRTIKLPDQSGCLPVLAADSATAITSTPEELNLLDGITAGTVSASLAVIADSNKDVTGFRNVTLTGELDAATGDFSGDVDIDGTTNLDAVDIDGAVQLDGTFTVGVDDTGFDVKFFGDAASAYMLWDASSDDLILGGAAGLIVPDGQLTLGSTALTATAAELNVTDGVTAGTVIASKALVADANIDITGGRNITITGELDAATLDISGDADIDGTTNLDAVDIDGNVDIAGSINISAAQTLTLVDNQANSLAIMEGSNNYINIRTSDSSERVEFNKAVKFASTLDIDGNLDIDADIDLAGDLTFSAVKDIKIVDNDAAALEIKQGSNAYLTFGTTNSAELITIHKLLAFNAAAISVANQATSITMKDNQAAALDILQGSNSYLKFDTTNSSELITATKAFNFAGALQIGGTAVTSTAAELNLVDGITAGTVSASLAVIVDSNKDVTGFRNITATGEVDTATLDVSSTSAFADSVTLENAKDLRFSEASGNGTNYIALKAAASVSSNVTFTLPAADGSDGQVIKTDGSGALSFIDAPSPAEFNGVTAGTVSASKGVEVDSNKDITGFRNVTLTGELDAATGDFSGDVDIDGTTNLDAVDIDGAVQIDATVTVGVDDTGYDVKFFGATSGASLLWDESADDLILAGAAGLVVPEGKLTLGSTAVTSTAAELNLVDGITAGTVSASLAVIVDSNKDITGFRNVTLTGELDAATLDVSGDSDLAGDLTFSAAKDIQIIDNNAAALEIAEAGNNYMVFVTTNSSEAVKVTQLLDVDANIDVATQATDILMKDNQAAALDIMEGSNSYIKLDTTDGSELVTIAKNTVFGGTVTIDSVGVAAIQIASESFADNDTSLMTSAAIQDKVQALVPTANGTFTAQLEGSTGNPGSKITSTAHYARSGDLVQATIYFNNVDTSSYSGAISISGLPIQAKDTAGGMFLGNVHNVGMISGANDSVTAIVSDNGTTIVFVENSSTTALNWGTVGTGKTMRVQVQYIAA